MDTLKKRQIRVSDIDIYLAISECESQSQVIKKLNLDKGGKSHKRIKRIMEKHNVTFKKVI